MTLKRGTSWATVAGQKLRINERIGAADLASMAANQGMGWEVLTNTDAADGSTAATANSGHDHTEAGNLIYRALATWQHGVGRGQYESTTVTYGDPYVIFEDQSVQVRDRALSVPVYVQAAFAGQDILVLLRAGSVRGTLPFRLTVYDSSIVAVSGYSDLPCQQIYGLPSQDAVAMMVASGLDLTQYQGWIIQVASAGLYALDIQMDISGTNAELTIVRGGLVVPVINPAYQAPVIDSPPPASSDYVDVGDPDASNVWQPIDSLLCTADEALHSALALFLNNNNNLMWELATDLPAPGNANKTVTKGHDHSGTGQMGPELDEPLAVIVFGGSIGSGSATTSGNHSAAVVPDNSGTVQAVEYRRIAMAQSANTTAGASKVKVAILADCEAAKNNTLEVTVVFGTAPTTRVFTCHSGYAFYTTPDSGTNSFDFTADAINTLQVSVRNSAYATFDTGKMYLYGLVLYRA